MKLKEGGLAMRKKVFTMVLGVLLISTTMMVPGCKKSTEDKEKTTVRTTTTTTTTTTQKKQVTTKKKKVEKIDIKTLSDYGQIKTLLSKYPKTLSSQQAKHQGLIMIENGRFEKNSKKIWKQFLKDVDKKQNCAIIICQHTVEGDPILQYISNVDGKFYYVEDSTRDAYGSEKYVQYTYDYYKIYEQNGHYTAILTTNNKLTYDEAQDVRSLKAAIQLFDIKEK